MAISATTVAIRGVAVEPIVEELLFANDTVGKELVTFHEDVKASTIFTENDNTVTMQAYTSGAPSTSGTLGLTDTEVTPVKFIYYQTFTPETLRTSRFNRTMKAGAWNVESSEFGTTVLKAYGNAISEDIQSKYWNNILAATQTAIAALTPGTAQNQVGAAEQTYAAALTAGEFDGVVTRMIYNGGALGGRVKVAGTALLGSNIATEVGKLYAAIPTRAIGQSGVQVEIYMPYACKQYINIYNTTATYRDLFGVSGDSYTYAGVRINFVPLPDNCMIAALPSNIHWCTDLLSDYNYFLVDRVASNQDTWFVKHCATIFAHVTLQSMNVLYLG